jgi:hypothetical protein
MSAIVSHTKNIGKNEPYGKYFLKMQVLLKWVITTDPFLATLKIVEQVLKITFTAWNAVVLGTVKGNAQ